MPQCPSAFACSTSALDYISAHGNRTQLNKAEAIQKTVQEHQPSKPIRTLYRCCRTDLLSTASSLDNVSLTNSACSQSIIVRCPQFIRFWWTICRDIETHGLFSFVFRSSIQYVGMSRHLYMPCTLPCLQIDAHTCIFGRTAAEFIFRVLKTPVLRATQPAVAHGWLCWL